MGMVGYPESKGLKGKVVLCPRERQGERKNGRVEEAKSRKGARKRRKKRSEERGKENSKGKGSESTRRPALLTHPRFRAVVPLSSSLLLFRRVQSRVFASTARAASLDNLSVRS